MSNAPKVFTKILRKMTAEATPYADVEVSWYPCKYPDGTKYHHPQFETDRGGVAQDHADYELYAFLASHRVQILELAESAVQLQKYADRGQVHAHANKRFSDAVTALMKPVSSQLTESNK